MIVPTCRCAFFAAVMLLGVFMSDIAPAKKIIIAQVNKIDYPGIIIIIIIIIIQIKAAFIHN